MLLHFLFVVILLIEIPLLVWRWKSNSGAVRTGVHMMAYTICCQFIFWLYASNIMQRYIGPCTFYSESLIPEKSLITFSAIFFLFAAVDTVLPRNKSMNLDVSAYISSIFNATKGFIVPIVWIVVVYTAMFPITRDFSILWRNDSYMLMNSSAGAAIPGAFSDFFNSLKSLVYYSACILLAVVVYNKRTTESVLLSICVFVFFVILMSSGSRSGAVGLMLFAIAYLLFSRRIGWLSSIALLIGIYSVQAALLARGSGSLGVSQFFVILALPFSEGANPTGIFENLFQGALLTADGLLVPGDFSQQYRVLSFSPLPSFIDGFDSIRDSSEIRLHQFCPMSATTEVVRFGPVYWAIFALMYFAIIRTVNSPYVYDKIGVVPVIFANILITFFCIVGFTYPLRNVLRNMIYVCVAVVAFAVFRSRAHRRKVRAQHTLSGSERRQRVARGFDNLSNRRNRR